MFSFLSEMCGPAVRITVSRRFSCGWILATVIYERTTLLIIEPLCGTYGSLVAQWLKKKPTCQCRRHVFDPWVSGRSPGEGNGNSFQCSCLGKRRGAWWATVHGIATSLLTTTNVALFLFYYRYLCTGWSPLLKEKLFGGRDSNTLIIRCHSSMRF